MKVGRSELKEDIQKVRLVRRKWNDVEIRLDANQAWTLKEAKEILSAFADCHLAYCEEPLQNPQELPQLKKFCEVNLALDETLWKDPELVKSIQNNIFEQGPLKSHIRLMTQHTNVTSLRSANAQRGSLTAAPGSFSAQRVDDEFTQFELDQLEATIIV